MSSTNAWTTLLSPLSPLLTYSPCITCDWTQGWLQGWDNSGVWDGQSLRWAEAWSDQPVEMSLNATGSGVSFLLSPTPHYNVTLSVNGTEVNSSSDLSSASSINATSLPFGTHQVSAIFTSIDPARAPTQGEQIRVTGVEIIWDGAASPSTVDDSSWTTDLLSYSPGWNLMSESNPSGNILNTTEAETFSTTISSFENSSISWTDFAGSSVTIPFTGNYIALKSPISQFLGTFQPSLDGVALPQVDVKKNLPDPTLDSSLTYNQVVWFVAGLEDTKHSLTITNVGGLATGDGALLMVDSFLMASVRSQDLLLASGLSSASLPASSTSPSASSSPSSSAAALDTTTGISSSSIGLFVAVGVGGFALLGLLILLIWKIRQRKSGVSSKASTAPYMKSKSGGPRVTFAPSPGGSGYSSHPFQPLVDESPQLPVAATFTSRPTVTRAPPSTLSIRSEDSSYSSAALELTLVPLAPAASEFVSRRPGLPTNPKMAGSGAGAGLVRHTSQSGEVGFLAPPTGHSPGGSRTNEDETTTVTTPDSASIYSRERSYFDLDDRSDVRQSTRTSDVITFQPGPDPPRSDAARGGYF